MILTTREQQLIKLIRSQPAGVSRDELAKQLNVSRRTIYRELNQLETDLAQLNLLLAKDEKGAYQIRGSQANLAVLQAQLTPTAPDVAFDADQRQNALIVRLLMSNVPVTMSDLATELTVSLSTIKQDLDVITPALEESQLTLNRQKATGVWISGKEADFRRVLVGVFASTMNPYLFFQSLRTAHVAFDPVTAYFMALLPNNELQAANRVFTATASLANLSDDQRKLLLLTVALHAMRVQAGYHVPSVRDFNQERLFQDQQLALSFFAEMPAAVRQQVRVGDYQFLAMQLNVIRGGLVGEQVDPFDLTINLQVQRLLSEVDKRYPRNFRQNARLYASLVAHIQRSAAGATATANPVLAHLATDYPELYAAVAAASQTVFGANAFTGNELDYLVLYFASVMSDTAARGAAHVLLVTSDGPGTGQLIIEKLRQLVPAIDRIDAKQVSDLAQVDFDQYDLILSTVQLPGFSHQYLVITPLLSAAEIGEIQRQLSVKAKQTPTPVEDLSLDRSVTTFEALRAAVETASDLLARFDTWQVQVGEAEIDQALTAILLKITPVVNNVEAVLGALRKRLDLAPVGIPYTHIALIHTANSGVNVPFIGVFDLSEPVTLPAMDMKTIALQRVLLLLTPPASPASTMQLLSAVSGELVQDAAHLHRFETGNYSQIYQLITEAFLSEIQKIDRR